MCSWSDFPIPRAVAARSAPSSWSRPTRTTRLRTLVVAEVTTNLSLANDPACLFIDASAADGKATGVLQDSVLSCVLMATIKSDRVDRVIGVLSDPLKQKLSACLKAALELP